MLRKVQQRLLRSGHHDGAAVDEKAATTVHNRSREVVFAAMSAPDLSSKTAIVTGATRGIGKETAVGLARMGATVVVTARDVARGESAVGDVKAACGHDRVELVMLDLASL